MAGDDKLWTELKGADGRMRPLLAYSIAAIQECESISQTVVVVAGARVDEAKALVEREAFTHVSAVVAGGERRRDSVRAGLDELSGCEYVLIHDGARPLVTPQLIEGALVAAREAGAACVAIPVPDTVKTVSDGCIAGTLDRTTMMLAQTPQAFRYDLLMDAHIRTTADATDDASMVEALDVAVRIVPGSSRNIKVTTADDLALVRALLKEP